MADPASGTAPSSLQPFYREIAALPAKQRLDRMLSRKDVMRVVRHMPVPDLLATVKDVGVADALEVLELMSPAQVQGVLDLDGWRKDRIDTASVGGWLRALFAADADRATSQLRGLDLELLTLLFKVHCRVYDLSQEEQPPENEGGRHSVTPDQRYLIVYGGVAVDDETQAALQVLVDRLMARDMNFVLKLCEAVRWELASQLEEDAFRWRNARLADLGFLPQHEAAAIFAWLDPDKPLPQQKAPAVPPPPVGDELTSTDLTTSPLLPWGLLDGNEVLARALKAAPMPVRDRVAHELMLTANRVHSADGQDIGDTDALKETARTTLAIAGTGLAWIGKGEEGAIAAALSSTSVMVLFRVGHSLSLRLQNEVRARLRAPGSGLDGRGLLRLDAPLREVVAGFLRARPVLFGGLLDDRRLDYRPVASLPELAAAAAALTEAAFRAALLEKLGATDAVFNDIDDAELPSHAQALAAWLVHGVRGAPAWRPVADVDDLPATLPPALLSALDDKVRAAAPLPGAVTADEAIARTRAYVTQVWSALVKERQQVKEQKAESRFFSSVWSTR